MEKDNKTTIISILLALICLGILGYIVYLKVNQKKVPTEEPNNNDVPVEKEEKPVEEPTEKEVENKKIDELVKNLYSIIGSNPEFRYESKVTYETLSESVRDSITLKALDTECKETTIYAKEFFESKYKEIFGKEKIDYEGICNLDGGNYECTRYCSEFGPAIYNKYIKYEELDNLIIIYETVGHFDYHDDGKVYLKADASDELAIASFNSLEEFENSSVSYKLPTYAHTFQKNNDNYYWIMSEKVD